MITLYASDTSNGHRAAIMLEEVGLAYEIRMVDLWSREHKQAHFTNMNSVGKVPLIHDPEAGGGEGLLLSETLAICSYLGERTGRLQPSTAAGRYKALEWAARIVTGFNPASASIYFARKLGEQDHQKLIAKLMTDFDQYLGAMDSELSESRYLAGDEFTFADVMAVPSIITTVVDNGVDLTPYRSVLRWRDEAVARPGVQAGMAKIKAAARGRGLSAEQRAAAGKAPPSVDLPASR